MVEIRYKTEMDYPAAEQKPFAKIPVEVQENPKYVRAQKDGKPPMEYLPLAVLEGDAWVHKHGADKYGIRNWRKDKIRMSTYVGALLRHLKAWSEGEDLDPDSGYHHLNHIRACCGVVLDADAHGMAIDDRTITESKG